MLSLKNYSEVIQGNYLPSPGSFQINNENPSTIERLFKNTNTNEDKNDDDGDSNSSKNNISSSFPVTKIIVDNISKKHMFVTSLDYDKTDYTLDPEIQRTAELTCFPSNNRYLYDAILVTDTAKQMADLSHNLRQQYLRNSDRKYVSYTKNKVPRVIPENEIEDWENHDPLTNYITAPFKTNIHVNVPPLDTTRQLLQTYASLGLVTLFFFFRRKLPYTNIVMTPESRSAMLHRLYDNIDKQLLTTFALFGGVFLMLNQMKQDLNVLRFNIERSDGYTHAVLLKNKENSDVSVSTWSLGIPRIHINQTPFSAPDLFTYLAFFLPTPMFFKSEVLSTPLRNANVQIATKSFLNPTSHSNPLRRSSLAFSSLVGPEPTLFSNLKPSQPVSKEISHMQNLVAEIVKAEPIKADPSRLSTIMRAQYASNLFPALSNMIETSRITQLCLPALLTFVNGQFYSHLFQRYVNDPTFHPSENMAVTAIGSGALYLGMYSLVKPTFTSLFASSAHKVLLPRFIVSSLACAFITHSALYSSKDAMDNASIMGQSSVSLPLMDSVSHHTSTATHFVPEKHNFVDKDKDITVIFKTDATGPKQISILHRIIAKINDLKKNITM